MTTGRWVAAVAAAVVGVATVAIAVVTTVDTDAGAPAGARPTGTAASPARPPTPSTGADAAATDAPTLRVDNRGTPADGLLLSTPKSGRAGLLISDSRGQPVWFKPVEPGQVVGNLQVATYQGRPVLVYYQGVGSGYYRGTWHVLSTSYREIATIKAGGSAQADIHSIWIRPDDTAVVECYTPVTRDLSAHGGSAHATVLDSEIQRIDIATGRVLADWHSLDHLPVTETYAPLNRSPVDYMHTNTLGPDPGHPDNVVVSARHLSQVFSVNLRTGRIDWRVGGRHPTLRLTGGAVAPLSAAGTTIPFSFQHDAHLTAPDTLTLFDNGNQRRPTYSRSTTFRLDRSAGTVTERPAASIRHDPDIYGGAHGSTQSLPGGHTLVSWGTTGRATEYDAGHHVVSEITSTDSYRLLRQPWTGRPTTRPTVRPGGTDHLAVSWNGATDVASWQVRAGSTVDSLRPVGGARRAGFVTSIVAPAGRYVQVQARDAAGRSLGTSAVTRMQ